MAVSPMLAGVLALAAAAVSLAGAAPATGEALTVLRLVGDVNAWPLGGATRTYTPADGAFTASDYDLGSVHVTYAGGGEWWNLTFTPPAGVPLTVGAYENVLNFPLTPPTMPGMNVQGNGAGCEVSEGSRFTILELERTESGGVARLAVDFEEHCYGLDPAVFGSLRVNSTVPLGLRVSAMPAAALERDEGTAALTFVVWLSERSATPMTVHYTTVGGTAEPGVDFAPVSGTAWFPARDVTAQVVVPILANTTPQPDRTVLLRLSEPSAGQLAFAEATGTIIDDDAGGTYIHIESDPGDWVGQGRTEYLSPLEGSITTSLSNGGVHVVYEGRSNWDFHFAPPQGQALTPGVYELATRYPVQSPTRPGLDINGNGHGCNGLIGRFLVHEAQFGPDGDAQRLAVDLEQHCESLYPSLFASIRINSAVETTPRFSVAPTAVYEGDGEPLNLRFLVSIVGLHPGPVTVDFATADETAHAGIDYEPRQGTAHFPVGETSVWVEVPVLGDLAAQGDRTMSVVLSNPAGAPIAFGTGEGRIVDDDGERTFLYFDGEDSYVIGDSSFSVTPLNGRISTEWWGDALHVVGEDGAVPPWSLVFLPPTGAQLGPGIFERNGSGGASFVSFSPGFTFDGYGRSCWPYFGRFTVLEIEKAGDGSVTRLAIDYEQHCNGSTVFGAVRLNSAIPMAPRLSVSPAGVYEGNGEPVSLEFTVSLSAPAAEPVAVDWATADGTAAAGSDYLPVAGTATFAPGETTAVVRVPVIGDTRAQGDRAMHLTLTNPRGAPVAFGQGTGLIGDDDELTTFIVLDSTEGDSIGLGRPYLLRPLEGVIDCRVLADRVTVSYSGVDSGWSLDFAAPGGRRLEPGIYLSATRQAFGLPDRPGIDVTGEGRGCSSMLGTFAVSEARYDAEGGIEALALDFVQRCDELGPPLFGAVRINSSLPADPRATFTPRVRRRPR